MFAAHLRFLCFIVFLSSVFCDVGYADNRSAFSLIEQSEKETLLLMLSEQADSFFIHVGVGHGDPPVEIEKEDFQRLKEALLDIDLSRFETILPPDLRKNYIIVFRDDYDGERDTATTYSIPKDSTSEEIKAWITSLKMLADNSSASRALDDG